MTFGEMRRLPRSEGVLLAAQQAFAEAMAPYVPYDTGALAGSAVVGADGVRYRAPYAARVYNGAGLTIRTGKNPLATAGWDRAAFAAERGRIAGAVRRAMVGKG